MHQHTIRRVLAERVRLSADACGVGAQGDLYLAGMTSHASVRLGLEDAFDIEFPDEMLRRGHAASQELIDRRGAE